MARFRSLAKSSAKPGILTPWSLGDLVDLFEILKSCLTPRIATSILHLTPSNFQMLRWKCEGSTQSKSCSLDELVEKNVSIARRIISPAALSTHAGSIRCRCRIYLQGRGGLPLQRHQAYGSLLVRHPAWITEWYHGVVCKRRG